MAKSDIAGAFVAAARSCDDEAIKGFLDQGVSVNTVDPRTGAHALHYAAAYSARPAFRVITQAADIDYLARDNLGRLPSEMASVYGRDPAMARLMRRKELQQAQAMGLKKLPFREVPAKEPASVRPSGP